MSVNVNVIIQAKDEASKIVKSVSANVKDSVNQVRSAQEAAVKSTKKASDSFLNWGKVSEVASGMIVGFLVHDALGAVKQGVEDSIEQFIAFDKQLTTITSAAGLFGDAAEGLRKKLEAAARAAGVEFGVGANAAAEGLEALVKAGLSGQEAVDALRASLTLATLESISADEATGYLVQAMTMFNLRASDAARIVDLYSKASDAGIGSASDFAEGLSNCGAAASSMDFSLKDTLAALVVMDKTFGSAVQGGTYLNSMFKDMTAKSDDLGLSLYNADGSMKSLGEIVGQLRKEIKSFGGDQKAVNDYLSNFDVRGKRAVIALTSYDRSVDDVSASLDSMSSAQDKVNALMESSAGQAAKTQAKLEDMKITLGEELTPAWLWFQEVLTAAALGWVDIAGKMSQGFESIVTGIGNFLTGQKKVPAYLQDSTDAMADQEDAAEDLGSTTEKVGNQIEKALSDASDAADETAGDFSKFLDELRADFNLTRAQSSSDLAEIATSFNDAFLSGDVDKAAGIIRSFASEYDLSLKDAKTAIDDFTSQQKADIDKQKAALQAQEDAYKSHMDKIKSFYFDVFTSESSEFQTELDAVAQNVYSNLSGMNGNFEAARNYIDQFATKWGLTWDEAESKIAEAVEKIKSKVDEVPQSFEAKLVGEAQSHLEDFKNCVSGKGRDLSDNFYGSLDQLVADTNTLIENGLVGQAQDNIEAFKNCSTNKSAEMEEKMVGDIADLKDQYADYISKMNDALEAGNVDQANLWSARAQDVQTKINTIQGWLDTLRENAKKPIIQEVIVKKKKWYEQKPWGERPPTPEEWQNWIEGYQHGGLVTRPTLAVLGEAGPELVIPLKKLTSHMPVSRFDRTERTRQVIINSPLVIIEGSADERLVRQVSQRLVRELRRMIA